MNFELRLALLLLVFAGALIGMAAVSDLAGRDRAPEAVARRYFAALEAGDAEGALSELAPSGRASWRSFVENGLHNEYRIKGIAVRQPAPLARLWGLPAAPHEATIFLEITLAAEDVRWEAGPRVPLVQEAGRWYLTRPPLAPDE